MATIGFTAPATTAAFSKYDEIALSIGSISSPFAAFYGTWVSSLAAGNANQCIALIEDFHNNNPRLMEGTDFDPAQLVYAAAHFCSGDFSKSTKYAFRVLDWYNHDRDLPMAFQFGQDLKATAQLYAAFSLFAMGRVQESSAMCDAGLLYAEKTTHAQTIACAHVFAGILRAQRKDIHAVRMHADSAFEISSRSGLPVWQAFSNYLKGWALSSGAQSNDGRTEMNAGRISLDIYGMKLFDPLFRGLETQLLRRANDDNLLMVFDEALLLSSSTGQRWYDAELRRLRGQHYRHKNLQYEAELEFDHAIAIARQHKARTFELRASLDLARLYCDTDREREAVPLLQGALVGFTETPELQEIAEARSLLQCLS